MASCSVVPLVRGIVLEMMLDGGACGWRLVCVDAEAAARILSVAFILAMMMAWIFGSWLAGVSEKPFVLCVDCGVGAAVENPQWRQRHLMVGRLRESQVGVSPAYFSSAARRQSRSC